MRNSLCAEFAAPVLCETSFSWLGVGEKKSAITSWQNFQEVVVQQHQTGEDGKVNMTNTKRFHTLIIPLSAPRRIHNLHLSLLPLPTLYPSNTLKCLFSFDVDGGSLHAAAQIRDMMKNTTEARGGLPAEECLS